jgi:heme-degrading monooxygenase HmoA
VSQEQAEPCQSFLVIPAPAAQHEAILKFYHTHQVLERSQRLGASAGAVVRSNAAEELVVTSLWESGQHFQDWVASDERARILDSLAQQEIGKDARGWSTHATMAADPETVLRDGLSEAFPGRSYEFLTVAIRPTPT